MKDPDFLDSAAKDLTLPPIQPIITPMMPTARAAPQKIELPDFTDDELAAANAQQTTPQKEQNSTKESIAPWSPAAPATSIKTPELPALEPMPSSMTVRIKTQEPLMPAPANAIARPREEMMLPTGELLEMDEIVPAKFLSSANYSMILTETKAIRKGLRQNDEAMKDATLRHEQLDAVHKRVAIDANGVQEALMRIDSVLFEE